MEHRLPIGDQRRKLILQTHQIPVGLPELQSLTRKPPFQLSALYAQLSERWIVSQTNWPVPGIQTCEIHPHHGREKDFSDRLPSYRDDVNPFSPGKVQSGTCSRARGLV